MLSFLIIDDDLDFIEALRMSLEEKGHLVATSSIKERIPELLKMNKYDLLIFYHDGGSFYWEDILRQAKKNRNIYIIALVRHGDLESAVKAMKIGADNVYVKPLGIDNFIADMQELEKQRLASKLNEKRSPNQIYTFERLASKNFRTQKIFDEVRSFADTDVNILITGESGTGKGQLARTIHFSSSRADRDFIEINCSAIPSSLLESELFGYEKGAFTDARETRKGLFELADNSTLFLDEISTMDYNMQSKLLKVIEDFKFFRVGGRKEIAVNTRIITATNADLKKNVRDNRFRQDLYYRLNVAAVHLPPLRERREDIIDLFLGFVNEFNLTLNRSVSTITPEVAEILRFYDWPGNIRELRNVCERIMVIVKVNTIDKALLPIEILSGSKVSWPIPGGFKSLEEMEREHILATLEALKSNKSKAAKVLGISRTTLISKIKQYQLE